MFSPPAFPGSRALFAGIRAFSSLFPALRSSAPIGNEISLAEDKRRRFREEEVDNVSLSLSRDKEFRFVCETAVSSLENPRICRLASELSSRNRTLRNRHGVSAESTNEEIARNVPSASFATAFPRSRISV